MRKKSNIIISILTACMLLFTCSIPAFAANSGYTGHWAEKQLDKWCAKGLITGYSDGALKPDSPISRAQFTTVVSRLFSYQTVAEIPFSDTTGNGTIAVTQVTGGGGNGSTNGRYLLCVRDSNGRYKYIGFKVTGGTTVQMDAGDKEVSPK